MQRRSILPPTLAATVLMPALLPAGPAWAQPVDRPANIRPCDARPVMAPALPAPPLPSADPPSAFVAAARNAVVVGRTGAQEALERAETRLLDRDLPPQLAAAPDNQQAVLAIGDARRAPAAHNRQAATAAIDDAVAAADRPPSQVAAASPPATIIAPAVPPAPPPPPQPVITRALLPGHWALHGARYVWAAPETTLRRVESAEVVPGAYVWRNGAYVWVPTHDAN